MEKVEFTFRPIRSTSSFEIETVAKRMRETLIEVLGELQGGSMYSVEWLIDRVKFHLDPKQSTAQVFLSVDQKGVILGHTIVRVESHGPLTFGLFSTSFVSPEFRNQGIAEGLISIGEEWFRSHRLNDAKTYTSDSNEKLIRLYEKCGYAVTQRVAEKKMVILSKAL